MGEVWPSIHVAELRLTAGSGPWNGDEHWPYRDRAVKERCWLREFYLTFDQFVDKSYCRNGMDFTFGILRVLLLLMLILQFMLLQHCSLVLFSC